jgi:hypothetical protein
MLEAYSPISVEQSRIINMLPENRFSSEGAFKYIDLLKKYRVWRKTTKI